MLSIRNLNVAFEVGNRLVPVVQEVELEIPSGTSVALVGESGSGKTLTALSILQLLPNNARCSGSIHHRGTDLLRLDARSMRRVRGKEIAIIYQNAMSALNPSLTVGEQIAEVMRVHMDMNRSRALGRATELLELVGIPEAGRRINDYPYMFSGGMLQRAMIAMALSCGPKLLIADEPTTALDATIQAQVIELLRDLRDRSSMSLLFLTHDLGVVATLCDRVAVMYAGRIVEENSTLELFRRPRHPYTEGLLLSVARIDKPGRLASIKGSAPAASAVPSGCAFHPRCEYAETPRCVASVPPILARGQAVARCWRADELSLRGSR